MIEKDKLENNIIYAGFWRRFTAFLLDIIIINILYAIYLALFGNNISLFDSSIIWFFLWGYFACLESSPKQATFGKMALGLIVTDFSGNRISYGKASGRFWARILSHLSLGIGYLMIAFTKRKQSLHDKLANCLVIKKKPIRDSKGKITLIALAGLILLSFILLVNLLVLYKSGDLKYPPFNKFISSKLGIKSTNEKTKDNMITIDIAVFTYKILNGHFPKNGSLSPCSTLTIVTNLKNPITGKKGEGYTYMSGRANKPGIVGYESDKNGETYRITGYSYDEAIDTILEPEYWGEIKYTLYTVNLRASPSTKSRVIEKLESGRKVKVAFLKDNWYTIFKAERKVPSKSKQIGYVYATSVGANPPYDFRKTKWGMSEGEIRRIESQPLLRVNRAETSKFLTYKGKVAEMDCEIWYMFVNNKLIKGGYYFTDPYYSTRDLLSDPYRKLENLLSEKYGKQEEGGIYNVYAGWYTSTTYIELHKKEFQNINRWTGISTKTEHIQILYVSRALSYLEDEVKGKIERAKRKKALDKF